MLNDATATEAARERAVAEFQQGQEAHAQGELTEAVNHYDTALQLMPDFPEALYQRGMARLSLKQLEPARKDLEKLSRLEETLLSAERESDNPQLRRLFARVHSALGDISSQRGDGNDAELEYRRAIELDHHLQRARTSLASLLINRQAYDEAASELRAGIEEGKVSAEIYSLLGYTYEKLAQLDSALESYSKAIELEPRARLARDRRSYLRAERQDYEAAIEDFTVIYEQDRSAPHARRLAVLYERAGKSDEAINLYRQALEQTAAPAETKRLRLKIIDMLIQTKRPEEALAEVRQLVREHPDDADAYARLGSQLLPADPRGAAAAYQQAMGLEPERVEYRVGLSAALLKLKRYKEALAVSQDALKRAPENYYVHSNLATAYFQLQAFAQAADHFKWIVDHRPDAPVPYYFLGICFDKLMEYKLALSAYERFLELADANRQQMEIDNVKFRLPGVRRAIKKGRGRHHQ